MKEESIVSMIENEAEKLSERFKGYGVVTQNAVNAAYIVGRSKSIEAEKQKDERIKELEEGLGKAIKAIKQWHNADEVWDIYFNNAPEMKSIRELINNK